jgi:GT2 family glycosyltransferase
MSCDVSIIIVTYNNEGDIEKCLRSVGGEPRNIRQEIVIVDNDSKDGTANLIATRFPEVRLNSLKTNLGFAAAVNLAAKQAQGEFLLLLNPDTVVIDKAIDSIVSFARQNPRYGIYGGRCLKSDGTLEPSSCWGTPTLWSNAMFACGLSSLVRNHALFDPESLGKWKRDTVREVGVVTGCFLLITGKLWKDLGGFDERFFMYGEDVDLAIRARAAGFSPVICPHAQIIHTIGRSSQMPLHKNRLLYRGKATVLRTHWNGVSRWLGLTCLALGVGLRALRSRLFAMLKGASGQNDWITLWNERQSWLAGYANEDEPARR